MDDLISRKHFDERIRIAGVMVWDELSEDYKGAVCAILEMLKTEPSVTAERKTGKWIVDDSDNSIECRDCGCRIYAIDILHGEANFCPNCGAKMEEK